MTESQYTQAVHKYLPSWVYAWKINASFAKGVPDAYYSSNKTDLWIEYKFLQSLPKKSKVVPNLSRLQLKWLQNRHKEGRNVAVVVGSPEGSFILTDPIYWSEGFIPNSFKSHSKKEVALWIESFVHEEGAQSNAKRAKQSIRKTTYGSG
jgi:hypothetical protein